MSAINSNDSVIGLIAKYLAGEATPEEAMVLEDWLSLPDNKNQFEQLTRLWNKVSDSSQNQSSLATAWNEFENTLAKKVHRKKARSRLYIFAAAASLAGIIIITFFFTKNTVRPTHINLLSKIASEKILTDTLPDGSVVTMNRHTRISFSDLYNSINREVNLDGEAFFKVAPDKAKPFIIHIGALNILVTGTSFNVKRNNVVQTIEVQVESGIVQLYTDKIKMNAIKNETCVYSIQNNTLTLKNSIDINSLSYATKIISFNDEPVTNVFHYLEATFNKSIQFDKDKFSKCRLTAHFNEMNFDYIFEVINTTLNISSRAKGDTMFLTGNGCR